MFRGNVVLVFECVELCCFNLDRLLRDRYVPFRGGWVIIKTLYYRIIVRCSECVAVKYRALKLERIRMRVDDGFDFREDGLFWRIERCEL